MRRLLPPLLGENVTAAKIGFAKRQRTQRRNFRGARPDLVTNGEVHAAVLRHKAVVREAVEAAYPVPAPAAAAPQFTAAQVAALVGLPGQVTALAAQIARLSNSSALVARHAINPIPNAAGALPAVWFPPTLANLQSNADFTVARANALLGFYGLPVVAETIDQKRVRLSNHIGVRV